MELNLKDSFSKQEYNLIVSLLNREPNNIELALFSAMWSEHCSYKSSKVHLKKLGDIQSSDVIAGFGENAGVIDLKKGEKVAFKMESHNHPSYIEPFHGAMTGVGGILRDVFAMNARPIALANYLCFGEKDHPQTPHLVKGVVQGIGGYGNCIGIPMLTGRTLFSSCYNENIIVNALALGYLGPKNSLMTSQTDHVGADIIYVGARTGKDGIHGASMASESFSDQKEKKQSTVQIGDPYYGKLLMEGCLEVMNKKLVLAAQDMGAAGLVSSSFEMASKGPVGMDIHLDQIPLRDSTMQPEEILLSESQERMLLICLPENYKKVKEIFEKWNLSVCKIGQTTENKNVNLYWREKILTSLDPALLTTKAPEYQRPYKKWSFSHQVKDVKNTIPQALVNNQTLINLLKDSNGNSKEFIYTQYDQTVGGQTAQDCLFPIGITQLPHSRRFLGLALGGRPSILQCDSFEGGKDAIIYPALQLFVRGFQPLALTDCLNFGNPEKEEIMSSFVATIDGMVDAAKNFSIPIISGNVSFYNESRNKNIAPTANIGMVGIQDSPKWSQIHFKENEQIYLVYLHECLIKHNFHSVFKNQDMSFYGNLNTKKILKWANQIRMLSQKAQSIQIVHSLGLAYTLARMSLNGTGVLIKNDKWHPFQTRLYEIICTTNQPSIFEKTLQKMQLSYTHLGYTQPNLFSYGSGIKLSIKDIQEAYFSS